MKYLLEFWKVEDGVKTLTVELSFDSTKATATEIAYDCGSAIDEAVETNG